MRKNQSSLTAAGIAIARAVESEKRRWLRHCGWEGMTHAQFRSHPYRQASWRRPVS